MNRLLNQKIVTSDCNFKFEFINMAQANKRRYVFHFDLGNTILMRDYAEGVSVIDNVSVFRKLSELQLNFIYRWPESHAEAHGVSFLRKRL